ncbi:MAG: hypothetical protein J6Y79_00360 [Paludibacteraceae bacterium]|nr:hypothetical protein [Paludibacteraceae bacterium]
MAKNSGLIQFQGAINNVTGYRRNGKFFLAMKNSITKERILTDKKFQRTRENMQEFAGASLTVKALRTSLAGLTRILADNALTNRLTGIIRKEVQNRDATSSRGERRVDLSANGTALLGFNLNRENSFSSLVRVPLRVTAPTSGKGAVLSFDPFEAANVVSAPKGATHFCLIGAAALIGNRSYDYLTQSWISENDNDGVAGVERSDYFGVEDTVPQTELSVSLPGVTDTEGGAVVVIAGVEFYQQIGTKYYLLHDTNGGAIVALL